MSSSIRAEDTLLINKLHQTAWMQQDAEGNVHGRVGRIDGEQVHHRRSANIVVSRGGQLVQKTLTADDGTFSLAGLDAGAYALQVFDKSTYAAMSIRVMPRSETHLGSQLQIFVTDLPSPLIRSKVAANLLPINSRSTDEYYRAHDSDPIAQVRKFNNGAQVLLQAGVLNGRISKPGWAFGDQDLTNTVALVYRGGQRVGQTEVSRDGTFSIAGLSDGKYDVVFAGDDGFAAQSFSAVSESTANKQAGTDALQFVSFGKRRGLFRRAKQPCCHELCCELIETPEIHVCDAVPVAQCGCQADPCGCAPPAAPLGGGIADAGVGAQPFGPGYGRGGFYGGSYGGGFGGGGFGGGGGGFGGGFGGGAGGLLGVAGLAVGAAALASDDDGFNGNLATPIAP
ncbi:MAG: hypothetical protein Aurels2KO_12980 [Aureliella sp.]